MQAWVGQGEGLTGRQQQRVEGQVLAARRTGSGLKSQALLGQTLAGGKVEYGVVVEACREMILGRS
ncbi:hypothetical protein D3C87_2197550 [compost metagenome]